MNCKKAKDLILTDYIDGELDQRAKDEIDAHLSACRECFVFAESLKKDVAAPIRHAARQNVPEDLWRLVKSRIEEERHPAKEPRPVFEFITSLFVVRRPALGLAGVVVLFLIVSSIFIDFRIRQARETARGEYLINIFGQSEEISENGYGGFGTVIEEYFF